MARKQAIDAIVAFYQKLGGNLNDVLGTKTNINFLGKGKSPELMLDMDINEEALAILPQSKAVEELTSSVGYAVAGKLNDIQANQLIQNMMKMEKIYFPSATPANITDLATGTRNLDKEGLMSLRKADDLPPGDPDLPPPGSRGEPGDVAAPFASAEETIKNLAKSEGVDAAETILPTGSGLEALKNVKNNNLIIDDLVDKIYLNAGVSKNAQPVARANAREFLNRVKDLEDPDFPSGTTLSSIMEADDFKFMIEGGGGGMGDPLLLVQKYFGPKVATAIAKLENPKDIQTFAERLIRVKDGRGRSVTDRMFDPQTVNPEDFEFADGGQVPAADSQLVKETKDIMGYRGKKLGGEGILPNFLEHGYFMEKRYPRTEKLDTVKEIFEEETPKIQDVVDLSEGFTLSPITILRRILANMETKKADGGRVPYMAGMLVRGGKMGYQALRKYGIEGRDISRLFASLGTDKSLVGKEKTAYFQQLHKVLRNPDAFPDEIRDIQKQLGLDVGLGFKSGGLAKILEV